MSDTSWHDYAAKMVRTLQIIVFAILTGLTMFMVVSLFVAPSDTCIFPSITILSAAAFMLAIVGMGARSIALHVLTAKAKRGIIDGTYPSFGGNQLVKQVQTADSEGADRDARYLLTMYQIKTIVGAAFCEGFALFALVAFIVEGNYLSLGLAVLLMLFIAAQFPTTARVLNWVKWEQETLKLRSLR